MSWYLNDTLVLTNVSVLEAKCTLHAEVVGEHNVTAIASNANGSDMQTWTWAVTSEMDVLEQGGFGVQFGERLNCACGDICVNTTGWWRDGGAFNPSDMPIQDAIDNATAGETICVKDGIYTENVDVTKQLTIRSENGADSTIVNALDPNDNVFEVTADHVNIIGFTVKEAPDSFGIFLSGVNNCTISTNIVSGNSQGIYLTNSIQNIIANNTAKNNGYNGIRLEDSNTNRITGNDASNNVNYHGISLCTSNNNEIRNNIANSNHFNGIGLWKSSDENIIANNTAKYNGKYGILLKYSNDNKIIANNTAKHNGNSGITLRNSNNNEIRNNIANSNHFNGIYLNNSNGNRITDNDASNTVNWDGISLSSSNNNEVRNNVANSNNYNGIVLWISSDENIIANNTAKHNGDFGIFVRNSNSNLIYNNYFDNTFNAWDDGNNIWNITKTAGTNIIGGSWLGGNYWSDYAGEDTNGDGLGDTLLPYNSDGDITTGGDWHPLVPAGFAPPEITSFAPPSPVNDTVCNWRTFNVTVNQKVNVSWYLNGTLQATNVSVTEANCTLHAKIIGEHNVSVVATNANGTDMQTWIWNVSKAVGDPDLVITEKWLCWPDNCTICYNVTNIGSGTAPACHNTTLYVDGVAVAHDHVPVDLAPGESYIGCFADYSWKYTSPGDNITVCADNNDTLNESDETNNCLTNIWMCGDVNCDGKVTMSDVRKVFNRYLDPNYPLDLPWAADVNCDGKVSMSDVRKVFNRYLDPSYALNCCCEGIR